MEEAFSVSLHQKKNNVHVTSQTLDSVHESCDRIQRRRLQMADMMAAQRMFVIVYSEKRVEMK